MYLDFFGLAELPFKLLPDARFFFESRGHAKALSYLQYGLHKGEGFVVVTGEVGAGKTMLVETLLGQIGPGQSVSALAMTQLDPDDLLRVVGRGFGLNLPAGDRAAALTLLVEFLMERSRAGHPSLVVIDEAQNLPLPSLEALRLLTNLRGGSTALLQVFLIGQPALRALLARPELEQLMQRVVAMCHLQPLSAAETGQYIRHRLSTAGWTGDPEIDDDVAALVHREALGIARRINVMMDRLLLFAFIEQRHRIDRALAEEVIADLRDEGLGPAPPAAVREVDR
jgi:type II secretory pathway predicted ATPase ExeA